MREPLGAPFASIGIAAASKAGVASDRRDEAVAFLRKGLDEARTLGVVAQSLAELPDGVRKHFVGNEGAFPNVGEYLLLGHDLTGPTREEGEDLHRLGLDVCFTLRTDDGIGVRLDDPFAEPEVGIERHATSLGDRGRSPVPPSSTLAREEARPNVRCLCRF